MVRIPIPWLNSEFFLTAPLSGVSVAVQFGVIVFFAALLVGALIGLYRYELRLLHRGRAAFLLSVRTVLLLFLWLLVLQPAVSRSMSEQLPGAILIGLDLSDSMLITDPQRTSLSKLRLAQTLRLADDLVSVDRLSQWIQAETDASPSRRSAVSDNHPDRPLLLEVCKRVDTLSRQQIAQALLLQQPVSLVDNLAKHHTVDLVGFSQDIVSLGVDQIATSPRTESAQGAYTDLRLPLERALEGRDPSRSKTLAVVLLTDGQHNWGPSPLTRAAELGQLGIPVFPIVIGAKEPPTDVAIVAVNAPRSVFKGSEVPVEVRIQVHNLPARELLIQLQREGQPPLEERILHDGKTTHYTVKFQPRLDEVGQQALTVSARVEPGELRSDNNSRPVVINVADEKADVLLIDGEARWEFHYLHTALSRDRSLNLKSVVFGQPRLGAVSEEDLLQIGYPATQLRADRDGLNSFDCIILGDVSPDQFPLSERQRLERYVSERGGTLVVLCGKRFMPLAFGASGIERDNDPLGRLLPVSDVQEVRPVDGFSLRLTAEGRLSPFLQLDATLDRSDRIWSGLPRHYWGLVGKTKPGAIALAWFNDMEKSTKEADSDLDRQRNQAIIARQYYGFGRVLFVGIDSTWRWRYRIGDQFHHKFWGQVIRWAASDKPLTTGNEYVRFGTREPVFRVGREIEFIARFSELARPLGPDALAGVRLIRRQPGKPEQNYAMVPLVRSTSRPREWVTTFRDLPPGEYAAELIVPDLTDQIDETKGPENQRLRAIFQVAPPDTSEMTELAANRPLLEDIAARSGGKVFEPEDANELIDHLRQAIATRQVHVEIRLWRSWWTLLLLVVLVTAEWIMRKAVGLP